MENLDDISSPVAPAAPGRGSALARRVAELLDLGGLHRAVEAQTARTPEAVAVVGASAQLTYGELNRRANRLAHHLVARGVGLETLVGVYLERSLDMVVGLLGILKAGGAYVPLDPSYPSERLAWMLADSRARLVLTRQRQPEWLRGSDPEVIAVQADADEIAQEADGNLEVEVSPNHLAYVIYTSGSTGRPKGVLGLHRGVLSRLAGEFLPFAEGEVCCLKTPLNFVDSLWEVFAPLAWGLRTVLVEERELKEPRRLIRTLAHHRVTRLMLVPSLLQAILEASDDLPRQLPDLKYWYCGGELLTERLCDRFHAAMPAATLINGYGLSEVWDVTWYDTGRGKCPSRVPVGRPLRHVEVLLLDARGQPVPQGAAGEVYIGGAGLARGYLNRPDLTADRFVPHPFSPQPGARLYRSGDLARWRPDGDLEFIGRQDHQVKVRGYRIEPAEIQLALEAHPRVRQAAVRADEDQQGQPRLVAYVAGHKLVRASATRASPMPGADTTAGPVLSEGELRQFLRQRLPAHLVPDLFVVMDELPLTPNGKVDGLSLVAASRAKSDPTAGADRVRTETGTWLLETCRRLFAPVPVGFRDQFAALGMHSLLAMRLASQISRRFQVEVPAARILSIETVEALAQEIVAATQSPPNTACSGPKPIVRQGPLPASYAQRRLWFLERLVPGSALYNLTVAVDWSGALAAEVLEEAWGACVRRHEALRTRLVEVDGQPQQWVTEEVEGGWRVVEGRAGCPAERQAQARRWAEEEARRPFALKGRGPLWRGLLVQWGPRDHRLVLSFHHLIADGWSLGILLRELSEFYEALATGKPAAMAALPIQYADYAQYQRQWLEGEGRLKHWGYWREQLGGVEPLQLPTDHPRGGGVGLRGGRQPVRVGLELTRGLKALSRDEGATLFMTLVAGWALLLGRYSGQRDMVVGTVVAGRNWTEVEGVVGCFVNLVGLRVGLSGRPSFRGLIGRVREVRISDLFGQ